MAELDLDLIRHALSVARQNGFAEVELALGSDVFAATLAPGASSSTAASKPETQAPQEPKDTTTDVKATLVGYYRPSKTPLKSGMQVTTGDVVAVIAALGIANDIEAPITGEVIEVLVSDNEPVQYGQVLARIKE
ncbi:MAG TPA: biotin/lipoyl-containing protein [Fimbriimonas sp.]|nr:biotin/lipoyl-containing protein [Fimbriimonas sp.]